MASKHWLRGSMKSFRSHLDPEKEEHLKSVKIEIEHKVTKNLKLIKVINQGNRENKMKKKTELFQSIEDFHRQYLFLYSLYEDLRGKVRKKVNRKDDDSSSTSSADSESDGSPNERAHENIKLHSDMQDIEDDVLKEKLNSTIETIDLDSVSDFDMSINESQDNLKDLDVQDEQFESARGTAMNEGERLVRMKDFEIEALVAEKREMEERMDSMLNEAKELKAENSEFKAQILELDENSKEKDDHLSVFRKTLEEKEQSYKSMIEDFVEKANSFELEMNILLTQKSKMEQQLKEETSRLKDLTEQVNIQQQEFETMRNQKGELELELENKSIEALNSLHQIENLNEKLTGMEGIMEEKEGLKLQIHNLELQFKSLNTKKGDLEEKIVQIYDEAYRTKGEKEELQKKLSKLLVDLSKTENELNNLKKDFNALQRERNRLELELETVKQDSAIRIPSLEKENLELAEKLAETKEEHKQQMKLNYQGTERKIEELAAEFRKQFEDNLRILSRRIRVAEQLHAENKECYLKTKEIYEQENREIKERYEKTEVGIRNIKEMSLTANDILNSLETVGLKFEECTANFLNRISKTSCELKFAKDWARRKSKVALHVKDDLNCLLSQMDEKEAEILVFRERVWKSENKVRELEMIIKNNEDGMLVIQEEKREAIRQLCILIDHHRSRSDYYKKMLSEVTPRCRKTSQ